MTKNRQDKNQLGFKNHIANDQVDQISFKDRQDKNNLTLRTKMAVTKNVLKVKFDCIVNLSWNTVKFQNHINVIEDPTSAASLDPIKIPLCAYVEEEEVVEEPSQIAPAVNQTENKAFLDPHLGTVFPFH